MKSYLIDLDGANFNEISLKVTTSEDLIELNNLGWLDCWLDIYSPKTNWSKIKSIKICSMLLNKIAN